jgi:hypothetical protein
MKALLLSDYKKLSIVNMPTPETADDEVLVRAQVPGSCSTFHVRGGARIPQRIFLVKRGEPNVEPERRNQNLEPEPGRGTRNLESI